MITTKNLKFTQILTKSLQNMKLIKAVRNFYNRFLKAKRDIIFNYKSKIRGI
jgi:hypothetical protein